MGRYLTPSSGTTVQANEVSCGFEGMSLQANKNQQGTWSGRVPVGEWRLEVNLRQCRLLGRDSAARSVEVRHRIRWGHLS